MQRALLSVIGIGALGATNWVAARRLQKMNRRLLGGLPLTGTEWIVIVLQLAVMTYLGRLLGSSLLFAVLTAVLVVVVVPLIASRFRFTVVRRSHADAWWGELTDVQQIAWLDRAAAAGRPRSPLDAYDLMREQVRGACERAGPAGEAGTGLSA